MSTHTWSKPGMLLISRNGDLRIFIKFHQPTLSVNYLYCSYRHRPWVFEKRHCPRGIWIKMVNNELFLKNNDNSLEAVVIESEAETPRSPAIR